jgi:hypothetical protein
MCGAMRWSAGPARAGEPPESWQLAIDDLGAQLGQHLNALSFDLIDLRVEAGRRCAKVRLGGAGPALSLRLRGEVSLEDGGYARVRTRLDLGVGGRTLGVRLPTLDLVPQSFGDRSYLVLRLPILEGKF